MTAGASGPVTVALSISSFGEADPEPLEDLRRSVRVLDNPHGRKLNADEVADLLREADATIAGTEPLSAEVLEQAPRLKAISRVGVGLGNVDLDAAERFGIRVFSTPDAVTDAAAELALAGLLSVLRHVAAMDAELRAGRWTRRMGSLLRGKTVGIVGTGRIGCRVAALLAPFEVRLLGFDPGADAVRVDAAGIELVDLDELLGAADVVMLHAAGNERIVDAGRIGLMKKGAVLVNAARGSLVDEAALRDALAGGRLGGAYIDTFETEPYEGPLRELDNVVLTPHAGSFAREARALMEREAVDNLLGFLLER